MHPAVLMTHKIKLGAQHQMSVVNVECGMRLTAFACTTPFSSLSNLMLQLWAGNIRITGVPGFELQQPTLQHTAPVKRIHQGALLRRYNLRKHGVVAAGCGPGGGQRKQQHDHGVRRDSARVAVQREHLKGGTGGRSDPRVRDLGMRCLGWANP